MDVIVTLFYTLFSICVIYPPTEFTAAGFTIAQLFENFLGSENMNFVMYHMKRITITALIHSALPLGYVLCLFCCGETNPWLPAAAAAAAIIPLLTCYRLLCWWENNQIKHPVVKSLLPYVTEGSDWRVVAGNLNSQFRTVDKVSIQLTATSQFVATEIWLIKVTQYSLIAVQQADCTLVATAADSYTITTSGEDEIQFLNIEAIPTRDDIDRFTIRINSTVMRDLQPRLVQPVRVPDHLSVMPSLIERFLIIFKQYVEQNPVYIVDQELELCIGCMQNPADVKITRTCLDAPPHLLHGPRQCQPCNCRVLWCCSCIGRWWAARAKSAPARWLRGRATCPVCRAIFCVLDVCPVKLAEPNSA